MLGVSAGWIFIGFILYREAQLVQADRGSMCEAGGFVRSYRIGYVSSSLP